MSLTREGIAYRVARDLPEGSYVNLGVGIPSLVPAYLPEGREVFIQIENGLLGLGPMSAPGEEDPDLINANMDHTTLLPGASVFDHALSFAMIRGSHVTHSIIGAIEVAANGDLANWMMPDDALPSVGGAMDLAFGVPNVFVAMTHVTSKGAPKILAQCSCPLTAPRCVKRIYTDMALIEVTPEGLVLREVAPGVKPAEVQACTGAPLSVAGDCREMDVPASFKGVELVRRKTTGPGG